MVILIDDVRLSSGFPLQKIRDQNLYQVMEMVEKLQELDQELQETIQKLEGITPLIKLMFQRPKRNSKK